ncbi:glycosyltransferase [Anatilimnocola sp. NA78]|uniref:glycosyltransferase n=1 Tax=Anatilimnocola sp. NA78 TaxID=3415683 RepID=UPI003CE5AC31
MYRALQPIVEAAGEPVFAVTTVPIVADLMGKLAVDHWTYYCVDDFSSWPGLDQPTMERMERAVIARCDKAIAVSDNLIARLRDRGKESTLLSHGVDLSFWSPPNSAAGERHLRHPEHPLIVFWGVIDRRMNVDWIRRLAHDLTGGTILLVGPLDAPDPELLKLPRVVHRPSVPLAELPSIADSADVLVMPYADLPVTRAMQPLKLKEYLATGKPMVSSDLPAVREWSDCLDIASTPEEFSALVRTRARTGKLSAQISARQRLEAESWQAKSLAFEAIVCCAGQQAGREVALSAT